MISKSDFLKLYQTVCFVIGNLEGAGDVLTWEGSDVTPESLAAVLNSAAAKLEDLLPILEREIYNIYNGKEEDSVHLCDDNISPSN